MFTGFLRSFLFFALPLGLVLTSLSATAMQIAGISLADRICIDHGKTLLLNGAGIRQKAFVNIYVAALYLEQPSSDVAAIINQDSPMRIALHFVYDEVSREKLVEGWQDGFRLNHSPQDFAALADRFEQSSQLFRSVRAGDTLYIDYLPGTGTRVLINNRLSGVIPGHDFFQAVLRVWLGEFPTQAGLKRGMLGL